MMTNFTLNNTCVKTSKEILRRICITRNYEILKPNRKRRLKCRAKKQTWFINIYILVSEFCSEHCFPKHWSGGISYGGVEISTSRGGMP